MWPVYINEVLPNPPSGGVEWVEIFNPSTASATLNNWRIRDCTTSNSTAFSAAIEPESFFRIENKNSYFNNSSDDCVRLFDQDNNLIDEHPLKPVSDHQSYSRQGDGSWCMTSPSPNTPNNVCFLFPSPSPVPTPTTVTSVWISLDLVEVLPDPDDADEWVKIYNPNNFTVDLSSWRILNQSNYSRSIGCSTVDPLSICQTYFSSGFLRNSGGSATLIDPQKRQIDSIYWESEPKPVSTKKPTSAKKPTSTKKPSSTKKPTVVKSLSAQYACPQVLGVTYPPIATYSSRLKIEDEESPIRPTATILMFVGSLLVLSPLIFHDHKNKTK